MEPESLKYHPAGVNKAERFEAVVMRNLEELEKYLVKQVRKNFSEGITSVLAKSDLQDETIVRERIIITYRTGNGAITQLPQHAYLPAGVFSQYQADVIYKNKIDIKGKDGKILSKDGNPQILIRTAHYPGDLKDSYEFQIPPEKPVASIDWDDANYFLRDETQHPSFTPAANGWIAPERIITRDYSQPVSHRDLTAADKAFLRSIEEFNQKYRNVGSLEENFFKLVTTRVNVAENANHHSHGLKRILYSVRQFLSRGKSSQ